MDLWYVRTSDVSGDDVLAACEDLLTSGERERRRAFILEQHRHEYLVTRALCRAVLSTYVGLLPDDLCFRRNAHGRPELDPASDVRFNLANTVLMVVCAVESGREIGVDTEPLSRAEQILQIAASIYTPTERARLERLEHGVKRREAVRLWTLKEAYMKARGMGMAISPESFQIDVDGEHCRLDYVAAKDDDPARWKLWTQQIEDHIVGMCIERGKCGEIRPIVRHADLRNMLRVKRRLK